MAPPRAGESCPGHCLYEPRRIFPGVEWPNVITSASMLFRGECAEHTIISPHKGVTEILRNTIWHLQLPDKSCRPFIFRSSLSINDTYNYWEIYREILLTPLYDILTIIQWQQAGASNNVLPSLHYDAACDLDIQTYFYPRGWPWLYLNPGNPQLRGWSRWGSPATPRREYWHNCCSNVFTMTG